MLGLRCLRRHGGVGGGVRGPGHPVRLAGIRGSGRVPEAFAMVGSPGVPVHHQRIGGPAKAIEAVQALVGPHQTFPFWESIRIVGAEFGRIGPVQKRRKGHFRPGLQLSVFPLGKGGIFIKKGDKTYQQHAGKQQAAEQTVEFFHIPDLLFRNSHKWTVHWMPPPEKRCTATAAPPGTQS